MRNCLQSLFSRPRLFLSAVLGACLAMLLPASLSAQNMEIEQFVPSTGWVSPLENGHVVYFPAAAMQTPTLSYVFKNTGTETLNISSFYFDGDNITHFTLEGFVVLTLSPGEESTFAIRYNPPVQFTQQSTASLVINSNSTGSGTYTLNLRGAGSELYGPYSPLYGQLTSELIQECPEINNCIGRASGVSQIFYVADQADVTDTYRGTIVNGEGDLWIRVSTDGSNFTEQENLSFSPTESNLSQGILVHRGYSVVNTTGGDLPVYIKYIETITRPDGSPFVLIAPETLGLPPEIGGLAKFENRTDTMNSHNIILASDSYNGTFTPFLDYFDAVPNKTCNFCGHYSLYKRFYWKNMPPVITANTPLGLKPNESAIITTDLLAAQDYEDNPPPAGDLPYQPNPALIIFDFNSTTPLTEGSGILYLNGVPVSATTTFTLADLQAGLLSYENTNPDATNDSFVFRVQDSRGAFANQDGNTVFTFNIIIDEFIGIEETLASSGSTNLQVQLDQIKQEGIARFTLNETGMAKLTLYNLSGSQVAQLYEGSVLANNANEIPFNLAQLPGGIYLLLLQTDWGVTERVKVGIVK